MIHYMNLRPEPFSTIASGMKTYELRLLDEKRSLIQPGHHIRFTNTATGESLEVEVLTLHTFPSFAELYKALPLDKCGYRPEEVAAASPADMDCYYSPEKQAQYGVVAIEINKLDL